MRRIFFEGLLAVVFAALCMLQVSTVGPVFAQEPSPVPTYDPLAEPPLPPHPSEFELGRNLYWHWCMTCHGDRGQGLTDDWRATWVKDHQNCWARGCHAGRNGDQGFPIPTMVPLIIGDSHLARFANLQDLADFLKTTHPPQHSGILKDEEYRTIAVYVFTLNDKALAAATPIRMPGPTLPPSITPTSTPALKGLLATSTLDQWLVIILAIIVLVVFIWLLRKSRMLKK